MKQLYICILIFSVLLFSCTAKKGTVIKEFKSLLGQWERWEAGSYYIESWSIADKYGMQATSFEIKNADTVFAEEVKLRQQNNDIFYTVSFPGQNYPPVPFRLISKDPWTFENKTNDFPQRIIYRKPSADSLHAWIEGEMNGKASRMDFKMSRIKNK